MTDDNELRKKIKRSIYKRFSKNIPSKSNRHKLKKYQNDDEYYDLSKIRKKDIKKLGKTSKECPLYTHKLHPFLTNPEWRPRKGRKIEDLDRLNVYIWKNNAKDGKIFHQMHKDMARCKSNVEDGFRHVDVDEIYRSNDSIFDAYGDEMMWETKDSSGKKSVDDSMKAFGRSTENLSRWWPRKHMLGCGNEKECLCCNLL